MIEYALIWAGALAAFPAAIAIAAMCLFFTWSLWERFTNKFRVQGAQQERQRFKDSLILDSWWFSEDEPTRGLLVALANGDDVGSAREAWIRARKQKGGDAA